MAIDANAIRKLLSAEHRGRVYIFHKMVLP